MILEAKIVSFLSAPVAFTPVVAPSADVGVGVGGVRIILIDIQQYACQQTVPTPTSKPKNWSNKSSVVPAIVTISAEFESKQNKPPLFQFSWWTNCKAIKLELIEGRVIHQFYRREVAQLSKA